MIAYTTAPCSASAAVTFDLVWFGAFTGFSARLQETRRSKVIA